ncbi:MULTISPECIES: type I-F CRISPR-associated endoribonuclease Cas6/Csy4 [unclassified Pseudoalteromonas]|uniref:type I-F CRISPR-associated endoribonuclease Cas6/Csy4 n=1 Tax=unclassified Pseudoalteromonas TaxID=194690 RepID=UPI001601EA5F|nr:MULTISPECIES: type I-F CRISPR-associated endoribonuclease Cas6/Csy4 [unclassified Pseudoalteromonas]MBB1334700.1 type I-F CRISPR-associated endoribonuclease Cas6/Csy4 [Pseudoalteromonas sp. SR41-6]MBB1460155.1 type I-F CRISPR-associated endoribonuclease Cas6/Csy4 [Pseudoalteromonas sp. SG41-8]
MQRYYFIIHFLPKQANLALLTGRCISIMHGFILKHNIEGVGVTFPNWSDSSIGNVIAFAHTDMEILNSLKEQAYFVDMQDCGFFKLSQVLAVPEDCQEIRFIRNQAVAKIFTGESRRRLKRLQKRALARGEDFNPKKLAAPREVDIFHRVAMTSKSSQEGYILHIQKQNADCQAEPTFSNYGFASNEKFKGTVPDLSPFIESN